MLRKIRKGLFGYFERSPVRATNQMMGLIFILALWLMARQLERQLAKDWVANIYRGMDHVSGINRGSSL